MAWFGRPVQDVLRLPGQTPVAWAVFDVDWYLATYPEAAAALPDRSPRSVLAYYLAEGQARQHAPNLFFDEAWHRRRYRHVADAVRDGRFASAFDAYCQDGYLGRSPHWLFDEAFYRARSSDLSDALLQASEMANGYDHFLRLGQVQGRACHPLFDAGFCRRQPGAAGERPFSEFLRGLAAGRAEPRCSAYFDPDWYRLRYGEAMTAFGGGALRHYLCNEAPTEFDPLPLFSERFYLASYPEIGDMVREYRVRNGYAHFLAVGIREGRAPGADCDLAWYAAQDRVAHDLQRGLAPDAFAHAATIGSSAGLALRDPGPPPLTPAQAGSLFHDRARALLPMIGRDRLDFTCLATPALSVIMVLHDGLTETLQTLASLRAQFAGGIELILIDAGSTDETRQVETYVTGARVLRFDSDIGRVAGCNAAAHFVSADTTLLLSASAELAPGALAAALRRLAADPGIGMVGGKLVDPADRLISAGLIVWRDAAVSPYLAGAAPIVPEANFVRPVHALSADCLLLRSALLHDLEGFDGNFSAGLYADADFCLRAASAGYRAVYDPAVSARLGGTPPLAEDAAARTMLLRKHMGRLRFHDLADGRVQAFARFAGATGRRVLFIEDTVPLRHIGSGFVRSNDILQVMAAQGFQVTVFPVRNAFDLEQVYADMPASVEVMHDRCVDDLADHLAGRPGYYDVVWIARTHNLDGVWPILQRAFAGGGRPPMVVADTEAVAATRQAQHAALLGQPPIDVDAAIMQEMRKAHLCQSIVVVSASEAAKLTQLGFPDVKVVGHMRALHPTPRGFDQRAGLLFVGAIHQADSPNYDSLCWFVDEVLPLVEQQLGWETRLSVVGYTKPEVDLERFRYHARVVLRGALARTEPVYDQHRIFVAPTRYAAGTPYKIYEAASYGLPVVGTGLLAQQMGWQDGVELLTADVADPAGLAAQIVRLYRDPGLWRSLRDAALARLARENSTERYAEAIEAVLGPARSAGATG